MFSDDQILMDYLLDPSPGDVSNLNVAGLYAESILDGCVDGSEIIKYKSGLNINLLRQNITVEENVNEQQITNK